MNCIIKNGKIVNSDSIFKGDILITDGRISAIGSNLSPEPGYKVIDATDLMVLPGAIDAHTHLEMPMMGTQSADTYETGTRAAACGGVTTVIDYTLQEKGHGILDMIKERRALCEPQACVDFSLHGGISDVNESSLREMKEVVDYGVPSFKVYMVYDFGIDDKELYQVLKRAGELGAIITIHAENRGMIEAKIAEYRKAGTLDAWHHYLSRPEYAEEEADNRIIIMAKSLNVPAYIVHMASKKGIELAGEARRNGYKIYTETCPQYLKFTSEVYKQPDGNRYLCSPPIKGADSREALWKAINNNDIDIIATDHCPSMSYEKDWGREDFTKAPNGCMGIENMYPYILSEAGKGRLSYQKAVEICSSNVARIFGLAHRKGSILPGLDADIVLYDPSKKFTITSDKMHSKTDYTIWEGTELTGYPVMTMVRGEIVYKDGSFVGKAGYGEFIQRKLQGYSL